MNTNITQVFEEIYKEDKWTNGSGPGSQPKNIRPYVEYLTNLITTAPIRSILDIGCGDWAFMKTVDLHNASYLGIDLVESVILNNLRLYGSDTVKFMVNSAIDYIPENHDMIVIKDVMQHLSYKNCHRILSNITGKFRYLMITNDFTETNTDCENGEWRPVNVSLAPFNLIPYFDFKFQSVPFQKHTIVIKNV